MDLAALFESVSGAAGAVAEGMANTLFSDDAQKIVMQGAAELAGGLFTGNSYVPYGPGQWPADGPSVEPAQMEAPQMEAVQAPQIEVPPPEIGGIEM